MAELRRFDEPNWKPINHLCVECGRILFANAHSGLCDPCCGILIKSPKRLLRYYRAARVMEQIIESLREAPDMDGTLKSILDALGRHYGVDRATVWLYNIKEDCVWGRAGVGVEKSYITQQRVPRFGRLKDLKIPDGSVIHDHVLAEVIQKQEIHIVNDRRSDPRYAEYLKQEQLYEDAKNRRHIDEEQLENLRPKRSFAKSFAIIPLALPERRVGALAINRLDGPNFHPITDEELESIEIFAKLSADAIRRAQLYESYLASAFETSIRLLENEFSGIKEWWDAARRVGDLAVRLGKKIGLDEVRLRELEVGGLYHDAGKAHIDQKILQKPASLTDEERKIMKMHPLFSAQLLGDNPLLKGAAQIVKHHHERWDGKGYPDGIAGEQIPLGARIVSIADSFDAIISNRPYHPGEPVNVALRKLKEVAGAQFDAYLVDNFVEIMQQDTSESLV